MSSNEKQILKIVYNQREKIAIHLIANQIKLSNDYCRLICHSLERVGYLKLIGLNFCQVSPKGQEYFSRFDEVDDRKIATKKIIVKSEDKSVLSQEAVCQEPTDIPEASIFLDNLQDASIEEKARLVEIGYKSLEDLAEAPITKLIQGLDIDIKKAAHWINQARWIKGIICDEPKEIENET